MILHAISHTMAHTPATVLQPASTPVITGLHVMLPVRVCRPAILHVKVRPVAVDLHAKTPVMNGRPAGTRVKKRVMARPVKAVRLVTSLVWVGLATEPKHVISLRHVSSPAEPPHGQHARPILNAV